ncbi:MAG: hypothetical protein JWO95_1491 [Verrucomicrobiales bacterium]|nr:hypothetical protein [Verrucomicrobiales bacterium]
MPCFTSHVRRRWKLIAVGAIVGIAAVTIALTRSTPEPEYDGKPLSYWLDIIANPSVSHTERNPADLQTTADTALRQIGTNAYPLVIKWTAKEFPQFVIIAVRKWKWERLETKIKQDFQRKMQASVFFQRMRQEASTAVPMLSNIVVSATPTSYASFFARSDLQAIGTNGYAAIVSIMKNPNVRSEVRSQCVNTLVGQYFARKRDGRPPFEGLGKALHDCTTDQDATFRAAAKTYLQKYAPDLLTNNAAAK